MHVTTMQTFKTFATKHRKWKKMDYNSKSSCKSDSETKRKEKRTMQVRENNESLYFQKLANAE